MCIFEILDLSAKTEKIIFGDKKGQLSPKTDARA
jgi:hypothetical protein